MTKNEILKILESAKDKNGDVPMRLVRQAFEKLPIECEDAVSRKSVEDVLHGYFDGMLETDTCSPKDIYGLIELLPSVMPNMTYNEKGR